jgi:uncharacterized protein GlcG (DUF336 family)
MNTTHTLSHTDAKRIVATIEAELDKNAEGGAIAVVDEHGELMAFVRRDGCPFTSIYIAINKAYASRAPKSAGNRARMASR